MSQSDYYGQDDQRSQLLRAIREVQGRIIELERRSADPQDPINPVEFGSAFHALGALSLKVYVNYLSLIFVPSPYLPIIFCRLDIMTRALNPFHVFCALHAPMARIIGLGLHMEI